MAKVKEEVKKVEEAKEEVKSGLVEIYRDSLTKFRFRVKAKNGEIVGEGQAYSGKENCKNGFAALREALKNPKIVDLTIEKYNIKVG